MKTSGPPAENMMGETPGVKWPTKEAVSITNSTKMESFPLHTLYAFLRFLQHESLSEAQVSVNYFHLASKPYKTLTRKDLNYTYVLCFYLQCSLYYKSFCLMTSVQISRCRCNMRKEKPLGGAQCKRVPYSTYLRFRSCAQA